MSEQSVKGVRGVNSGDGVMSVREALALPAFRNAGVRVLHGDDRLDTPVRWVHVAESARAGHLLSGGELLLATGAGWGEDAASRRALVRSFAAAGAAALVLEIGLVWTEVPEDVLSVCRETGLPLVTTGAEIRFIDVSEQVHAELLAQQVARVEAMQDVSGTFTTMMVEGAPPQQLIVQASRLLGAPVVLEDPAHRVICYAEGLEQPSDLLHSWPSRSRRWESRLGHTGSVSDPVPLPDEPGWCVDVMARGSHWGRLIQLGAGSAAASRAGAEHVLRHAAIALAVERLGSSRPYSWEDLLDRSVLDRLSGNLFTTASGMSAVLEASGFRTRNRSLLALEVRGTETPETVRRIAAHTGWDILAAPASGPDAQHPGRVAAIVSAPSGGDVRSTLSAALAAAGIAPDVPVLVSPVRHEVAELARALRSLERIPHAAPGVTAVGATPVSTLMDELSDDVHVRDFGDRVLAPVHDYDRRHDGDLLATLAAVVRHPSSRSAAAAELHLSRTSLYSRIATVERLLGMDLNDGDAQFTLNLALRTSR